jgi:hypothetical protein
MGLWRMSRAMNGGKKHGRRACLVAVRKHWSSTTHSFMTDYLPSVISRNNHARAQAHCRSIVLGDTPSAAAVSGTVMPAK